MQEKRLLVQMLNSALKAVTIIVLSIVVAGGSVWFFNYWQDQSRSEEIGRPVTIDITDEDDSDTVADKLSDADMIRYGFYFETRMRFGEGELRPGTYTLRIGMSVPDIIDVITVHDASNPEEVDAEATTAMQAFDVTFIEGQRIEENAVVLEESGMPDASADYVAAAQDVDSFRASYPFLESVPQDASLEGFLFPDTYRVGENATASDVIGSQLTNFESRFTPEMISQAENAGLSVYEVVTLASIVEREASLPEERPLIASVYLNRIDEGMPLNADPAQQFGVGSPDDWWPQLNTDLLGQSKSTDYDTYDTVGLPPGPIANPGFASIQAVMQPAESDFLYFVTTGDDTGEHLFSSTLEEHNQKTCQEHPDYDICKDGSFQDALPHADNVERERQRIT